MGWHLEILNSMAILLLGLGLFQPRQVYASGLTPAPSDGSEDLGHIIINYVIMRMRLAYALVRVID